MAANLPAASQCSINLDQAQRDLALRLRELILPRHELFLHHGNPVEVDEAALVLRNGVLDRA
jgi:hypothetical protein